jgi:hypothetical protein
MKTTLLAVKEADGDFNGRYVPEIVHRLRNSATPCLSEWEVLSHDVI